MNDQQWGTFDGNEELTLSLHLFYLDVKITDLDSDIMSVSTYTWTRCHREEIISLRKFKKYVFPDIV